MKNRVYIKEGKGLWIMENRERYNVYIYGAGNEYNKLSSYLPAYEEQLNVLGIITTRKQPFSIMDGYSCYTLAEVDISNVDYIIIAVEKWHEIRDLLYMEKGIGEDKIIRGSAFFYPRFVLKDYLKLKKQNVTILSNYCLGGHIYHELGLKMLSPTINMFCAGKDYLEFLRHYEYYLKMDMKELVEEKYIDGTMGRENFVPKGIIDDRVVWKLNHDYTAKEAIKRWNIRRQRVNFDNVVALMTIQSDEDAYEFEALAINKKLGFYYKDLQLKHVIYCPEWRDPQIRQQYNWSWPSCANTLFRNSMGYVGKVNWLKYLLVGGAKRAVI